MGAGLYLMEQLKTVYHVGWCNVCREWTAFDEHDGGVFTCPMCGNFGHPGYHK